MQRTPYTALVEDVLNNGLDRGDRTGTGTRSVFGRQIRYNLAEGFPIPTEKKVPFKWVAAELLWFLSGSTNNRNLAEITGCEPDDTIWAEWALGTGDLGPIYGKQWRSWACPDGQKIDQIEALINQVRNNPESRRLLVSAWNPADLPSESMTAQQNVIHKKAALPACHTFFQLYVVDGKLSCHMYQRSADLFLGLPFNITSYALLTHLIAQQCYLDVGDLVISFGDAHIYHNHFEQVEEMLSREAKPTPALKINRWATRIDRYSVDDFTLEGYDPHPAIEAPVAV